MTVQEDDRCTNASPRALHLVLPIASDWPIAGLRCSTTYAAM